MDDASDYDGNTEAIKVIARIRPLSFQEVPWSDVDQDCKSGTGLSVKVLYNFGN